VLYRGLIGPGAHGIRNVTIQNNVFYQPYPGYPAVAAPEDDRFLENIVIRNNLLCAPDSAQKICNPSFPKTIRERDNLIWRQRTRRQRFQREVDQRRGVVASCAQSVTLLGTVICLNCGGGAVACFCLAWGAGTLVGSGGMQDEVPWVACHDARRVCGGRRNSSAAAVMTAPR
jgi:hypothetical protein